MTLVQLALIAGLAGFAALPAGLQDPDKNPAVPAGAKQADADFARLAWIAGTWVMQDGGKTIEEHWRPLQGTTLLGTSHTYDKGRTHFFEFLRIASMNGKIAYIAMPGGAQPTVFLMSKCEDGLVEFENPMHDHPQRIRYQRTEKGITATISQLDGSRSKAFVFERK